MGSATPFRRELVGAKNVNKYSLSMAPRVAKGKVFVGGSGGEFGARGFIAAYDAETGKEVWRFWTVPGDPAKGYEAAPQQKEALAMAATTWSGEYWKNPAAAASCGIRWCTTR